MLMALHTRVLMSISLAITSQVLLVTNYFILILKLKLTIFANSQGRIQKFTKTRLKILPVLTCEHYTSLLHWV
jgi:hypothetical protein